MVGGLAVAWYYGAFRPPSSERKELDEQRDAAGVRGEGKRVRRVGGECRETPGRLLAVGHIGRASAGAEGFKAWRGRGDVRSVV